MAFMPPIVIPIKIAPETVLRDIKITSPGNIASTNLEIDGKPCINAHAVKFEITADNWASAQLSIIPQTFTYEGKAALTIDADTAALLVTLGWTPPES